jgi:hypothetical protein
MKTFSVKNLERFQHYKDRAPPWIKLYNELLDDYHFGLLPDASKMHLIAIWLLASRSENKIPYDATWVGRRINANSKVDLDLLVDSGFIVVNQEVRIVGQDASNALAPCKQNACPEREGETEKRRDREEGEKSAAAPRAKDRKKPKRPLPDNFQLHPTNASYAKTLSFSDFEIRREHQKFCMSAKANDRSYSDWDAAEHNWFTKAAEFAGKRPRGEFDIPDDGMIEVLDQMQLEAWDEFGRAKTGKPYPRNKKGGWRFPSKWPPGYDNNMLDEVKKLVASQGGSV